MQVPIYAPGFLALCLLIGVAAIIMVCRANRDDLPAIARALMRKEPLDGDSQKGSPSLPAREHYARLVTDEPTNAEPRAINSLAAMLDRPFTELTADELMALKAEFEARGIYFHN